MTGRGPGRGAVDRRSCRARDHEVVRPVPVAEAGSEVGAVDLHLALTHPRRHPGGRRRDPGQPVEGALPGGVRHPSYRVGERGGAGHEAGQDRRRVGRGQGLDVGVAASSERYMVAPRPVRRPSRTPLIPSAFSARWATTCARLHRGSTLGVRQSCSARACTVVSSPAVAGRGPRAATWRGRPGVRSSVNSYQVLSVPRERLEPPAWRTCATRLRNEHLFEEHRPEPRPNQRRTAVADRLIIRGAREHNLRDVNLDLPRDALIVFTGLSGSGKSSLAFDTIFAEGQRRYVESLSAYARQFLGPDGQARRRLHRGPVARRSRSTRSRPRATRARPSARSPRSTTTCGCSSPGPASRTARSAASRSAADAAADRRPGAGDATRAPGSRCSPRSSAAARASTSTCSPSCSPRASPGPGSTAWSTR